MWGSIITDFRKTQQQDAFAMIKSLFLLQMDGGSTSKATQPNLVNELLVLEKYNHKCNLLFIK